MAFYVGQKTVNYFQLRDHQDVEVSGIGTPIDPYIVRSTNRSNNSTGYAVWRVYYNGTVDFHINVSSESGYDFVRIKKNNVIVAQVSGSQPSNFVTTGGGFNTPTDPSQTIEVENLEVVDGDLIRFEYYKDGSVFAGVDTGYLSYLAFYQAGRKWYDTSNRDTPGATRQYLEYDLTVSKNQITLPFLQEPYNYSDYTVQSPSNTQRILSNPSPNSADFFGSSTAMGNGLLVVGAPFDDANATDDGRAYAYKLANSTPIASYWTSYSNQNFAKYGTAVAVGCGLIAVGAGEYDHSGLTNAGIVNFFVTPDNIEAGVATIANARAHYGYRQSANGQFLSDTQNAMQIFGEQSESQFGDAIRIKDNIVAIGAPTVRYSTTDYKAGKLYVYKIITAEATQRKHLSLMLNLNHTFGKTHYDGDSISLVQPISADLRFGDRNTFDIGCGVIAVGSGINAGGTALNNNRCHISLFDYNGSQIKTPSGVQIIDPDHDGESSRFGSSVCIVSGRIITVNPNHNNVGRAYIYDLTGNLLHTIDPPAAAEEPSGPDSGFSGVGYGSGGRFPIWDNREGNVFVYDVNGQIVSVFESDGVYNAEVYGNHLIVNKPFDTVGSSAYAGKVEWYSLPETIDSWMELQVEGMQ